MMTQAYKLDSLCYWNFLPNYSYVKLLMDRQHEKPLKSPVQFVSPEPGTCRLDHSSKLA